MWRFFVASSRGATIQIKKRATYLSLLVFLGLGGYLRGLCVFPQHLWTTVVMDLKKSCQFSFGTGLSDIEAMRLSPRLLVFASLHVMIIAHIS